MTFFGDSAHKIQFRWSPYGGGWLTFGSTGRHTHQCQGQTRKCGAEPEDAAITQVLGDWAEKKISAGRADPQGVGIEIRRGTRMVGQMALKVGDSNTGNDRRHGCGQDLAKV